MGNKEVVVKQNIEQWKSNLIDLSKRNRMINFKYDKKNVLKIKESKIPDIKKWIENGKWINVENICEGYDVNQQESYSELDKLLKKLRLKRNSVLSEKGTNILYLTIGLLKWGSLGDSKDSYTSPILMVPIELRKSSKLTPYEMKSFNQEIITNPCLDIKLKKELGVEINLYQQDSDINDYITYIQKFIANHQDFELTKELFIGLYNFSNIAIYKELDEHDSLIMQHKIVKNIAAQVPIYEDIERLEMEEQNIGTSILETYQVLDADSSQQQAIEASKAGGSFVMQGPPGTGKSQTITNIIAECLSQGRTVLFVSEKMAALEVVHSRLKAAGLEDFCLELHSNKINKKDIISELYRQLNKSTRLNSVSEERYIELDKIKLELDQYVQALHTIYSPLNKSVYWLHGKLSQLEEVPLLNLVDSESSNLDSTTLLLLKRYAIQLEAFREEFSNYKKTLWNNVKLDNIEGSFESMLESVLIWVELIADAKGVSLAIAEKLNTNIDCLFDLDFLIQTCIQVEEYSLCKEWNTLDYNLLEEEIKIGKDLQKKEKELKATILEKYNEEVFFDYDFSKSEEMIWNFKQTIGENLQELLYNNNSIQQWINQASQLYSIIQTIEILWEETNKISDEPLPLTEENIKMVYEVLKKISSFQVVPEYWYSEDFNYNELEEGLRKVENRHRECLDNLSKYKEYFLKTSLELNDKLGDYNFDCAHSRYYYNHYDTLIAELNEIQRSVNQLLSVKDYLITTLNFKDIKSNEDIIQGLELLIALGKVSYCQSSWIDEGEYRVVLRKIEKLKLLISEIIELKNNISQSFEEEIMNHVNEELFDRFNTEYDSSLRIFKKQYHQDQRVIKRFLKLDKKLSFEEVKKLVFELSILYQKNKRLNELDKQNQEMLGYLYDGLETDFEEVKLNFESFEILYEHCRRMGYYPQNLQELVAQKISTEKLVNYHRSYEMEKESLISGVQKHQTLFATRFMNLLNVDLVSFDKEIKLVISTAEEIIGPIQRLLGFKVDGKEINYDLFGLLVQRKDDLKVKLNEIKEKEEFYKEQYGVDYNGLKTNWLEIYQKLGWRGELQEIINRFPSHYHQLLFTVFKDKQFNLDLNNKLLKNYRGVFEFFNQNPNTLRLLLEIDERMIYDDTLEIKNRLVVVMDFLHQWSQQVAHLSLYRKESFIDLENLLQDLTLQIRYNKLLTQIEKLGPIWREHFPKYYQGFMTDWDKIEEGLTFFTQLKENLNNKNIKLSPPLLSQLTGNEKHYSIDKLKNFNLVCQKALEVGKKYEFYFNNDLLNQGNIDEISEYLLLLFSEGNNIKNLKQYLVLRQKFKQSGYVELLDLLIANTNSEYSLADVVEKSLYASVLNFIYTTDSVLKQFDSNDYYFKVDQFQSIDKQLIRLNSKRVKNKLMLSRREKANSAQMSNSKIIINHENSKIKRHKPIRQLFSQTSDLVLALKPCLLMSPVTVSEFLEIDKFNFDLVIFDEASQICPESAVLSMVRGENVIVVGDSQQLPPTSFFKETNQSDDSDEFDGNQEQPNSFESILDLCTSLMPQKTLRWHYRSKDESLISFSNHHFYQDGLYTFPNSTKNGDLGVRFNYVCNGVYDRNATRTNIKEAEYVVKMIISHFNQYPTRSLGVITLSQAQMELIQRLLDQERMKYPILDRYFEESEESFFIKNLENVQGDERDTIILSICYGKDSEGVLRYQFGPLNNVGGERRLNVAITRAKLQLHVISSIKGEEIDLSRTKSRGVRLLKEYLLFAEQTDRVSNSNVNFDKEFESPLEEDICLELEKLGFIVQTNIGCSDYRISIAVVNPVEDNQYLLGIECNGEVYANTASTRDRARLRYEVLESMGWKIYHITSQEWYENKQSVLNKLKEILPKIPLQLSNLKIEESELVKQNNKNLNSSNIVIEANIDNNQKKSKNKLTTCVEKLSTDSLFLAAQTSQLKLECLETNNEAILNFSDEKKVEDCVQTSPQNELDNVPFDLERTKVNSLNDHQGEEGVFQEVSTIDDNILTEIEPVVINAVDSNEEIQKHIKLEVLPLVNQSINEGKTSLKNCEIKSLGEPVSDLLEVEGINVDYISSEKNIFAPTIENGKIFEADNLKQTYEDINNEEKLETGLEESLETNGIDFKENAVELEEYQSNQIVDTVGEENYTIPVTDSSKNVIANNHSFEEENLNLTSKELDVGLAIKPNLNSEVLSNQSIDNLILIKQEASSGDENFSIGTPIISSMAHPNLTDASRNNDFNISKDSHKKQSLIITKDSQQPVQSVKERQINDVTYKKIMTLLKRSYRLKVEERILKAKDLKFPKTKYSFTMIYEEVLAQLNKLRDTYGNKVPLGLIYLNEEQYQYLKFYTRDLINTYHKELDYPTALFITICLVKIAEQEYEGSDFWGSVFKALNLQETKSILKILKESILSICVNEDLYFHYTITDDKKYKRNYRSTILIHAIVTNKSTQKLFDFLYSCYFEDLKENYHEDELINYLQQLINYIDEDLDWNQSDKSSDEDGTSVYQLGGFTKMALVYYSDCSIEMLKNVLYNMHAWNFKTKDYKSDPIRFYELYRHWRTELVARQIINRNNLKTNNIVKSKNTLQSQKRRFLKATYLLQNQELNLIIPEQPIDRKYITSDVYVEFFDGDYYLSELTQLMDVYGKVTLKTMELEIKLMQLYKKLSYRIVAGNDVLYHSKELLYKDYLMFDEQGNEKTFTKISPNPFYLLVDILDNVLIEGFSNEYKVNTYKVYSLDLEEEDSIIINGLPLFNQPSVEGIKKCMINNENLVRESKVIKSGIDYNIYSKAPEIEFILNNGQLSQYVFDLNGKTMELNQLVNLTVIDSGPNYKKVRIKFEDKCFAECVLKEFSLRKRGDLNPILKFNYILLEDFDYKFNKPYYNEELSAEIVKIQANNLTIIEKDFPLSRDIRYQDEVSVKAIANNKEEIDVILTIPKIKWYLSEDFNQDTLEKWLLVDDLYKVKELSLILPFEDYNVVGIGEKGLKFLTPTNKGRYKLEQFLHSDEKYITIGVLIANQAIQIPLFEIWYQPTFKNIEVEFMSELEPRIHFEFKRVGQCQGEIQIYNDQDEKVISIEIDATSDENIFIPCSGLEGRCLIKLVQIIEDEFGFSSTVATVFEHRLFLGDDLLSELNDDVLAIQCCDVDGTLKQIDNFYLVDFKVIRDGVDYTANGMYKKESAGLIRSLKLSDNINPIHIHVLGRKNNQLQFTLTDRMGDGFLYHKQTQKLAYENSKDRDVYDYPDFYLLDLKK